MSQFPSVEQLGTRIPQNRSQVVTPAVLDQSGTRSLGAAVQQYAFDMKQRQDNLNLQKAKTHWAKTKLQADNAFDQDQDYGTYLERYTKMLDKGEEEALELISNPNMKALFKEDVSLSKAGGLEQMKDFAFQREKDIGIASLQDILADNREIALNATTEADRAGAFDTMNDSIEIARLNGYIDSEKAQSLRTKVGIDAAIGTIQVQDLKTQKMLLSENEGPAQLLPTDTRKKMLEQVNGQLVNEQALQAADEIRAGGGTLEERYRAANEIKDLEIREKTKQQIGVDYGREERAVTQTQYDSYQALAKDIISGASPQEVIRDNPRSWEKLTAEQQINIQSMGKKKVTDLAAYHRINLAMGKGQMEGYLQFMQDANKLAPTEFKHFSDMLAKGPDEPDPLFTVQQDFSRYVGEQGLDLNDDEKGQAELLLREERNRFQANNPGKKMNAQEQDDMMGRVFDVVVEGGWFSSDIHRFELSPKERQKLDYKTDVKKFQETAEEVSKQTGQRLTKDQADALYTDMVRQGIIQPWNVNGSNLPVDMVLPDGSFIDRNGNVTLSSEAYERLQR